MDILNTDISNISIDKAKSIKSKKTDNCQELKNIAYKTMLLNGTDINPKYHNNNKTNDLKIANFLENESIANRKETWAKLDKTQKMKHIINYTAILKERDNLSNTEIESLKKYLTRCLDRKCLIKSKEVIYDKEKNLITNIPFLVFNKEQRTYLLKKDDKHVSTIKSLPTEKRSSKPRTIKIHEPQ